ncbi:Anaerobic dimethyl sulfoxide reductase chain B [Rubripirellula tenax]|uniref:Anaerobic dimethyl sulfoxide reductase chain B n=1 Tax=Rubripirellula tenax TaxID=2528015 RepID=A0A5C6ETB9_9BACT|nr:DmsC/YnfH family molybdoenzyme membrane anchor subunit [Rubripirellula tenax]TWU50846.1 Anaerobic dimethyl sulfoxide reductase chain B [Rubripirellula tenax]
MSSTLPITERPNDLIGQLLSEQQSMSAVERFSARHEAGDLETETIPAQARYYRDLLPASPPGPGQQFAFEVNLDTCSGCKACVVACHTLNGLEEDETWRRVGTLTIGESSSDPLPVIQHVTTACHHCEDPGCLNGCPVKAYDKDPITGIVRHLDDQCIGCKYCTMMCPYEVPQYSDRLGIVRKCDMCHQRLSAGEAPACVQACPNQAIAISVVDQDTAFSAESRLAPGAPLSTITKPSTRYTTSREHAVHAAMPQDTGIDHVAESHWPLAVMLVATQASVGAIAVERSIALIGFTGGLGTSIDLMRWTTLVALLIGGVGLNVAPLHLGKPLRAWRVFLGLRTSWLSREAIVLGKYMGLLSVAVGLAWLPAFADYLPDALVSMIPVWAADVTLTIALLTGLIGLFSSGMIYVATRRRLWRMERTMARFFGSAVVLGFTTVAIVSTALDYQVIAIATGVLGAASMAIKLAWECKILLGRTPSSLGDNEDHRSQRLVQRELGQWASLRLTMGGVGAVCLMLGSVSSPASMSLGLALIGTSLVAHLGGELMERLLYFSSVVYDRMPGTFR